MASPKRHDRWQFLRGDAGGGGNGIDTQHFTALTTGAAAPTLAERADFVLRDGVPAALLVWIVVLPPLWMLSRDRVTRVAAAFAVFHPVMALLLAPGVAASGSLFRSAAAVFPVLCAGSAVVLVAAGRWTNESRGYPLWLVPSIILSFQAIFWVGLPVLSSRNPTPALPPASCDVLRDLPAGEAVFSPHPLLVEAWCGRPSVLLVDGLRPEDVAANAERYHVRHALVYPASVDPAFPKDGRLLPGWHRATAPGDIERWDAPYADASSTQ